MRGQLSISACFKNKSIWTLGATGDHPPFTTVAAPRFMSFRFLINRYSCDSLQLPLGWCCCWLVSNYPIREAAEKRRRWVGHWTDTEQVQEVVEHSNKKWKGGELANCLIYIPFGLRVSISSLHISRGFFICGMAEESMTKLIGSPGELLNAALRHFG